jgi:DNA-directed RNA polymerase specialized sigma24 family protein
LLTAFDGWSQQEAGHILRVSTKTIEPVSTALVKYLNGPSSLI